MKKHYATPVALISGSVVRETLGGSPLSTGESQFVKTGAAGGVGFYL